MITGTDFSQAKFLLVPNQVSQNCMELEAVTPAKENYPLASTILSSYMEGMLQLSYNNHTVISLHKKAPSVYMILPFVPVNEPRL